MLFLLNHKDRKKATAEVTFSLSIRKSQIKDKKSVHVNSLKSRMK